MQEKLCTKCQCSFSLLQASPVLFGNSLVEASYSTVIEDYLVLRIVPWQFNLSTRLCLQNNSIHVTYQLILKSSPAMKRTKKQA